MLSYANLLEILENHKNNGEENEAINIVRIGNDLRKNNDVSFWDDFINLCSNSKGLSELLGVEKEKISRWPAKIKEALEEMNKQKKEEPSEKENKKMIPTGDTGSVVVGG